MTKRYREAITVDVSDGAEAPPPPVAFTWRGHHYCVTAVLGHWREDAGFWHSGGMEIPQRDLWRVEARNSTPVAGIYELVHERGAWRLDRVWD